MGLLQPIHGSLWKGRRREGVGRNRNIWKAKEIDGKEIEEKWKDGETRQMERGIVLNLAHLNFVMTVTRQCFQKYVCPQK